MALTPVTRGSKNSECPLRHPLLSRVSFSREIGCLRLLPTCASAASRALTIVVVRTRALRPLAHSASRLVTYFFGASSPPSRREGTDKVYRVVNDSTSARGSRHFRHVRAYPALCQPHWQILHAQRWMALVASTTHSSKLLLPLLMPVLLASNSTRR